MWGLASLNPEIVRLVVSESATGPTSPTQEAISEYDIVNKWARPVRKMDMRILPRELCSKRASPAP